MPTDFQDLSPWLLQRFAVLVTVTETRLLVEHSLSINLERYFHEASNAEVYTNPYFRSEVETHTRSTINTPVFTNNPKGPVTFDKTLAENPKAQSRNIEAFHKLSARCILARISSKM
jgi:hypothetical protein